MNYISKEEAQRPLWAQIAQNALLAVFILAAATLLMGIMRGGGDTLYIGEHVVDPLPYFSGSIAIMVIAAALIVKIGRHWPSLPNQPRPE